MVELWGTNMFKGGTRRKRGRRQRGGANLPYTVVLNAGGTRRNRGRRQKGGVGTKWILPAGGRTRRNRGRRQRGGIEIMP